MTRRRRTSSSFGPLTFSATYAIYKDSTSRDPGSLLFSQTDTLQVGTVPEPSSIVLLGLGVLGALTVVRRCRRLGRASSANAAAEFARVKPLGL